jgi:hypothetical protein
MRTPRRPPPSRRQYGPRPYGKGPAWPREREGWFTLHRGLKSRRLLPLLCVVVLRVSTVGVCRSGPALAMKGKLRWEREAETASCSRWSNRGRETGELALENNCELRAFLITLLPLLQNCSERYTNSNSI